MLTLSMMVLGNVRSIVLSKLQVYLLSNLCKVCLVLVLCGRACNFGYRVWVVIRDRFGWMLVPVVVV